MSWLNRMVLGQCCGGTKHVGSRVVVLAGDSASDVVGGIRQGPGDQG